LALFGWIFQKLLADEFLICAENPTIKIPIGWHSGHLGKGASYASYCHVCEVNLSMDIATYWYWPLMKVSTRNAIPPYCVAELAFFAPSALRGR
jgi:hypothetical protein